MVPTKSESHVVQSVRFMKLVLLKVAGSIRRQLLQIPQTDTKGMYPLLPAFSSQS